MNVPPRLPFIDLRPADDAAAVLAAVERVVRSGWYVLGPEVEAFEAEFASWCGARHAVAVGSGTDALTLLLKALDIGPGDEVIVPAMTAAFTGLAVVAAGATPVFADVEPATLTLDPDAVLSRVTARSRAIIPVHLYGQPADMTRLLPLADRHGLAVVEDCCQAHGATSAGQPVGTLGAGGAFSFYPTKNLGALGDGGAVVTGDAALAERIRRLRNGGQAVRGRHVEAGVNSRLDEVQAAVLRARLPRVDAATRRRRALAARYREALPADLAPVLERDRGHVYHLFPVRTPRRDELRACLAAQGVETLVHYPVPLPAQPAFARFRPEPCPAAALASAQLVSLPLHPGLSEADVARVAGAIAGFLKGSASS